MGNIFRKKNLQDLNGEVSLHAGPEGTTGLHRVLNVRDLTLMGVAAVIGGGIFSTIGSAAYNGGPGVILLFVITAITCGFTALCYAEFASRIPVAGSAYTYSYVSFGEVVAWIIGWALILEYAIGNIVVAISWSAYFNNILHAMGLDLPRWLTVGYQTASNIHTAALANGSDVAGLVYTNAPRILGVPFIINLPAFVIVALISMLAYIGIQESKRTANAMVMIKIVVLVLVAIVGFWFIFSNGTTANWTPFLPNGMDGVLKGVSAVFFAYIGFDAISTTAEECANPQRDLPKGMIYSLIICTVIYIVIAFTFRSYSQPLLLLFLIPFSLPAVAWGHWIHDYPVNILSMLGIIALIGIMVNDGLVLIGKFNNNLREGLSFDDALYEAGRARFRAIFLTSITTVAGLAPLIFEESRQAQFLIPMAISIAYGIGFATLLTLIVLPIFLSFSNNVKTTLKWLQTGNKISKEEVERVTRE